MSDDDCNSELVPSELFTESALGFPTTIEDEDTATLENKDVFRVAKLTLRHIISKAYLIPWLGTTTAGGEMAAGLRGGTPPTTTGLMEIVELGVAVGDVADPDADDPAGRRCRRQFGLKFGCRFACLLQNYGRLEIAGLFG